MVMSPRGLSRLAPIPLSAALIVNLLSGGCTAPARITGGRSQQLPLPEGIQVVFNHRAGQAYRSPITGRRRRGDDLEAFLLTTILSARRTIDVAVQELSLPGLAEGLIDRHRDGVRVRVVLENTYSAPWSDLHPADLTHHQRRRVRQLRALGHGDAIALLQRAGVPLIDDTADGSAGSGLMHHKFVVVDGRIVVTGSANFSPSGLHGDPDDPRTRGNVNHLLRFESAALAEIFTAEFERLWGDGPGGSIDSRFGLAKEAGAGQRVEVRGTPVEVLFTPHRRDDPHHGLLWLERQLSKVRTSLDMSLFVLSGQNIADALQGLQRRGVTIRLLADPGFANRSFSEVMDLLGVALPDHRCRIEANNRVWSQPLAGVGTPRLAGGDKLHHKFAVLDRRRIITGSFNWSPSAAHQNDEVLIAIDSPTLARHFEAEMDRLWRGAELGITPRLRRKLRRRQRSCGSGIEADPVTSTID